MRIWFHGWPFKGQSNRTHSMSWVKALSALSAGSRMASPCSHKRLSCLHRHRRHFYRERTQKPYLGMGSHSGHWNEQWKPLLGWSSETDLSENPNKGSIRAFWGEVGPAMFLGPSWQFSGITSDSVLGAQESLLDGLKCGAEDWAQVSHVQDRYLPSIISIQPQGWAFGGRVNWSHTVYFFRLWNNDSGPYLLSGFL